MSAEEEGLKKRIRNNVALLDEDFVEILPKNSTAEFSIDPNGWLKDDCGEDYAHSTKRIDMLFIRRENTTTPTIVIVELKCGCFYAENAFFQLLDYYNFLKNDDNALACIKERAKELNLPNAEQWEVKDFKYELWLVVEAKYISRLLKEHWCYLREDLQKIIRIRHCLVETKAQIIPISK